MSLIGNTARNPLLPILPSLPYSPSPEQIRPGHPDFMIPFAILTPVLHSAPQEQMVDGVLPPGIQLPIDGMEVPEGTWQTVRMAAGIAQEDGTEVAGVSFFGPDFQGEHTQLRSLGLDGSITEVVRQCDPITREGGLVVEGEPLADILGRVDAEAMRDISRVALSGASEVPPDLPKMWIVDDTLKWYDGTLGVVYRIVRREGASRHFEQIVYYDGRRVGNITGYTAVRRKLAE